MAGRVLRVHFGGTSSGLLREGGGTVRPGVLTAVRSVWPAASVTRKSPTAFTSSAERPNGSRRPPHTSVRIPPPGATRLRCTEHRRGHRMPRPTPPSAYDALRSQPFNPPPRGPEWLPSAPSRQERPSPEMTGKMRPGRPLAGGEGQERPSSGVTGEEKPPAVITGQKPQSGGPPTPRRWSARFGLLLRPVRRAGRRKHSTGGSVVVDR